MAERALTRAVMDPIERIDGRLYARWRNEWVTSARRSQMRYLIPMAFVVAVASFATCFLFGLGLIPIVFQLKKAGKSAPKELAGLAPDPPEAPVYPVRATLMYRHLRYGKDAGMLAVCDGWLHYEGIGFSCSLRSSDVLTSPDADSVLLTLANGRKMKLAFYSMWDGDDRIDTQALRAELRQWASSRAPDGESVYPPFRYRSFKEISCDAPHAATAAVIGSVAFWLFAVFSSTPGPADLYGLIGVALMLTAIAIMAVARLWVPETLRLGRSQE